MSRQRLFVAIELPQEAATVLASCCVGLRAARWTNADKLHLTLVFIGERDPAAKQRISDALRRIECPQFELNVRGVGMFKRGSDERVLWAGCTGSAALMELHAAVEGALAREVAPEEREYAPHVTLGRTKNADGREIDRWLEVHHRLELPPFTVSQFHLFESERRREGATHTRLESYPLVGKPR